jgi:SAM-dependent methyltransferase
MRAARTPLVPVQVVDAGAGQLPFEEGSFDGAVASLVLCSVPDQQTALAGIGRVLCPGGQLRLYEHIRSEDPSKAPAGPGRVELATPARRLPRQPRHPAGHHRGRFRIEVCRRFEFRLWPLSAPASPHGIGVAGAS